MKPGMSKQLYTQRPAIMCSIKGPEIRNTMFKDNAPIKLEAGKEVRSMLLVHT